MKLYIHSMKYTRLFYHWMISYSSILLIPLILIIVSYYVSIKSIENEISKVNQASINQVKNTLDNIFYDVRRISNSLIINDEFMNIITSEKPLTSHQRFSLYKLSIRFKDYRAGNSYVSDYFLYSRYNDFILNSSGYMSTYDYYDSKDDFGFKSYEQWLVFLRTNSKYKFHHVSSGASPKESRIIFNHTLPLFSHNEQTGGLVISINEKKLHSIIDSMIWGTASDIVILDDQNKVILSTDNKIGNDYFLAYDFMENRQINHAILNGREVVLTSGRSNVANFTYVFAIPKNIYLGRINLIRYLTVFGITLCLLAGGLLSFIYSKKNYGPIHSMVKLLSNDKELLSYNQHDEIKFILFSLKWIMEERRKNKELLMEQRKLIRNNFLMRLVNGRLENELKIREALNSYQICFNSEHFAVILINMENTAAHDTGDNGREPLRLIIQKAFDEFYALNYHIQIVEFDEYDCIILNYRNCSVKQQIDLEITRLSYKVKAFLDNHFGLLMTFAISKTHWGIMSIPLCYREALKAMEYKLILGNGEIIHYEEIRNSRINIFKTYYSLEDEQKLAYCIKACDFNRARRIILDVMHSIFSQDEISIMSVKCAISSMINTILSSLSPIGGNMDSDYLEELHPFEKVFHCKTIEEMKSTIVTIFDKISSHMEKAVDHKKRCSDIIQYIHDNYQDYAMNVSMISAIFNINISYLSRMFKAYRDENISDYINRVRVEKSKELLLDPVIELSIKEIALQCGFYNSNAYIRVFKKFLTMTPGAFKAEHTVIKRSCRK
jgi:two-component system, response regulator YesN